MNVLKVTLYSDHGIELDRTLYDASEVDYIGLMQLYARRKSNGEYDEYQGIVTLKDGSFYAFEYEDVYNEYT